MKLYEFIANELVRLDTTVREAADANLRYVQKNFLPSGSGIDNGCEIDQWKIQKNKLVFFKITFYYHHMNDAGYYTHWTEHRVTVTPNWNGIDFKISGRDTAGLKDYLYDIFHLALTVDRDRKEFEYREPTIIKNS